MWCVCVCVVWVCLCLNSPVSIAYRRRGAWRPAAHNEGGEMHANHGEPVKACTSANLMKPLLKINLASVFPQSAARGWKRRRTGRRPQIWLWMPEGIRRRRQGGNAWQSKRPDSAEACCPFPKWKSDKKNFLYINWSYFGGAFRFFPIWGPFKMTLVWRSAKKCKMFSFLTSFQSLRKYIYKKTPQS